MSKLDESLLSGLPPFSRSSRPQIREILDQARTQRFEEGTEVFGEGLEATHFYLLLDGYLRVVRTTPGGEQIIVLHISPGQLFGIAAALQRDTYPATAVTAAESIVLSWPSHLWQGFTAQYDGFATESYKTVGQRLGQIQDTMTGCGCGVAHGQSKRTQDEGGDRDRLSRHTSEYLRYDRHDLAHGQPDALGVGERRDRAVHAQTYRCYSAASFGGDQRSLILLCR